MGRSTLVVAVLTGGLSQHALALEVPFEARRVIDNQGDNPRTAVIFDVDGDGDNDVIAATLADNTFAWYENDGEDEPGFTKHVLTSSAGGAREVWAADINSDGRLDILGAARAADAVYWYRNEGGSPPTFTEFMIAGDVLSSWSVYAADIDGDGDLDVTSAGRDDDRISWHENDGADPPTWTKHVIDIDARRAQKAFADDVDGDGDMDMLSASGAGDEIAWYENDGAADPSFVKHSLTTSANNAKWVWTADLDRDGDVDILAAAETEATIEWFENNGAPDPTFTRRLIASVGGAKACVPIDIDHDGDLDVLSNGIGLDHLSIHENLGGVPLQWNTYVVSTESDNPLTAFPGDIDGDGRDDILAASFEDDTIGWYRNDWIHPSPVYDELRFIARRDAMHESFVIGDINSNGATDVVLGASTGEVEWIEYTENGAPSVSLVTTVTAARDVAIADVDGDGACDVVVVDAGGDVVLCISSGGVTPIFTPTVIATGLGDLSGVASSDIDRDGDVDIVVTELGGGVIALLSDGASPPTFSASTLDTTAIGGRDPEIFDINSDGAPDIIVAASDLDRVIVYQSNGDTPLTFQRRVMPDDIPGPWDVEVVDLNNDGLEDLALAVVDGFVLHMMFNDGASDVTLSGFGWSAANLVAIDAGNPEFDGTNDVVGYSLANDTFRYAENYGGQNPFLFITSLPVEQTGVRDLAFEDLDHDGLLDIVYVVPDARGSAIGWIPNRGGQARVTAMSLANPEALIGRVEPMFVISVENTGIRYDDGVKLAKARVRFLDSGGQPLSAAQAGEIISTVRIYADVNNTSTFERLGDQIVFESSIDELTPDGEFPMAVDLGASDFDIPAVASRVYFVAVELTETAAGASPNQFIMELLEGEVGDVVQSTYEVPVRLWGSEGTTTTPIVTATVPAPGQVLLGLPWIRHVVDNTLYGAEGPRGADVNNDGHTDYAIAWEQSHVSMLYLHPGIAGVRDPWPGVMVGHAANAETAVPHDLDNDGDYEVLSALSAGPREIRAHFPPDDPADILDKSAWTTSSFTQTPIDLWVNVEPVDIDGVNGVDLVIGSIGREGNFNAQIGWLRCPEDPADTSAWTYHQLIEVEWALALVGSDMDNDGDQDIVYSNRFGASDERGVFWLENPGAGSPALAGPWTAHPVGSVGDEVGYLDLIRDETNNLPIIATPVRPRKTDIHTATDASGDSWDSEQLPWPDDMGPTKAARFADIDMDGNMDLVLTAVEAREDEGLVGVAWLRNPGPGGTDWNAYDIAGLEGEKFDIVAIEDVDGDGDMDVLASEEPDNDPDEFGLGFVWYENPLIQTTGDVNRDRVTDSFDLAALLGEWGGGADFLTASDLNNDGKVDALDLAIILAAWGQTWGPQPSE